MISKWYYALGLCGSLSLVACLGAGTEKGNEQSGSEADTGAGVSPGSGVGTSAGVDTGAGVKPGTNVGTSAGVDTGVGVEAADPTAFKPDATDVARSSLSLRDLPEIAAELRMVPNHDATISPMVTVRAGTARIAAAEEGSLSVSLEK
jgi:hypothetical protein